MRPALIAPLLALSWGLNWPAIKIILTAVPPFTLRGIGLTGGALLLALIAVAQGKRLRPPPGAWPGIVVGGMLTIAAFNFCTAFAQIHTSTSRAAVLTYTMPMLSAVLAWAWLGERPGRRGALALGLGSAGIAVLAWPVLRGLLAPGPAGSEVALLGLLFPLLAALGWAAGTVATKRWPPVGDRIVITAWQLAFGGALGAIAAHVAGEPFPAGWPQQVAWAMAYHIAIAMALGYVLWARLLEVLSATASSLTVLAAPVVGVLGAMLLVGDRPSAADGLGFVLVLGAAALMLLPPARQMPSSIAYDPRPGSGA
jgi:drug/metabolite transporter (DMT)-like permease